MSSNQIASSPDNPVVLQIGLKSVAFICALQILLVFFLLFHPFGTRGRQSASSLAGSNVNAARESVGAETANSPWGELIVHDMDLQRPDEYLEVNIKKDVSTAWNFRGTNPAQVRSLLASYGFNEQQLERAFAPESVLISASSLSIRPDDDLLLSLDSQTRGRLYSELSRYSENYYMANPFHVKEESLDKLLTEQSLPEETITLFKKLLYSRGNLRFFSDIDLMFRRIPSENNRRGLLKVATSEPAVLARLKIRPDTNIDKVMSYWTNVPGVRCKDVRPLFESVKRLPEGGSLSLLYLLPPFARNRLYTFPMPPQPGEATHDCFWTALNYFNETPDDRLGDINYVGQYVKKNFFQIAKATMHGDLIFVCDAKDSALHAAIFLADDIVFTKNGVGYMQPWVLMRLPELLNFYSTMGPTHAMIFRSKSM